MDAVLLTWQGVEKGRGTAQGPILGNVSGTRNRLGMNAIVDSDSVRKQALVQGAAWTAAVAAVLACLKFLGLGPIPDMSLSALALGVLFLCAMALGWALVLVKALGKAQQAALDRLGVATSATREVIDSMAEVTGAQMSGARAEMLRADQLLGDAIDRLVVVFEQLTTQARVQSDLAQATPAAEELRAAAERVASDVNSAVMALQFRDMVGQKLGHVREKLVAAEEAMYEIRLASAQFAEAAAAGEPDAQGPEKLTVRVYERLQQLHQAEATTPVRQQAMHAGEIELF